MALSDVNTLSKKNSLLRKWIQKPSHAGYFFLAPAVVTLLAVTLFPLIYAVNVSLHQYIISKPYLGKPWVGLGNYARLFTDKDFYSSLKATFIFAVPAIGGEFLFGLCCALLLNRKMRGLGIIRTIIVIPMMIAPVVVGLMWKFMLDFDAGILNYFIRIIGFNPPNWLGDKNWAIPAIIITDIWQWTPLFSLLILAGLQSLPNEPFEAAKVDGASNWQTFTRITFPMLGPFILIALLLRVIDILRIFDKVFVMTGGGPGRVTVFVSLFAYRQAFSYYYVSYGIAAAFAILLIITVLANLFIKILKKDI
ncbi:MAG TPA: sugar ABC transporter permease [bacterium]|nr:sugar ABC transporter permease [bacterium]